MPTLAIDIGGTKIRAGLVVGGDVVASHALPTEAAAGAQHVLERVISTLRLFAGYDSIAVAAAGVIADGRVLSATDLLPGWAGTDIREALAAASGLPVAVLGDVHAHALGEATWGAGRGYASSLTVAVGTGIGGAFVVDGQVLAGDHHLGGHFGHMSVGAAAALACSCGRTGHIEPLASGSGVCAQYQARTGQPIDGKTLDERAEAGEEAARAIMHDSAFALGELLASVANFADPGVIILSGSMTRSGPTWWEALRAGYAASAMDLAAATPVVVGELGDNAPLLGAAAYGKEWQ